ncbi:MAG: NHL repeat-containing protein [Candidatus Binataceae bacterium]
MNAIVRSLAGLLILGAIAAAPAHAFDALATMFVANRTSITAYRPGSSGAAAPTVRIATQLVSPAGIAIDSAGNAYVTLPSANTILVYPPRANGNTAARFLISGPDTKLDYPIAAAVDSSGSIYVVNDGTENAGSDSITVYRRGSQGDAGPIAVIAGPETGLGGPHGIAVDAQGRIYVANDNSDINIYSPGANGNVKPVFSISGLGTAVANAIAVDSNGNIYVAAGRFFDAAARILIYRPGAHRPIARIYGLRSNLDTPYGIAVDRDFIYVTNNSKTGSGAASVNLYPNLGTLLRHPSRHDWPPIKSISGPASGLDEPWGIAAANGAIHVANRFGDSVTAYSRDRAGNPVRTATITGNLSGLSDAAGIALDAAGNIYVANASASFGGAGSILVYPPGADRNAAPARIIGGPRAKTSDPTAIALDPRGYIVVANRHGGPAGAGGVSLYPACAAGDAAPAAVVAGARTGLNDPDGVAVDSNSTIYVANYSGGPQGNGSITIYRRSGNGDLALSATIAAPEDGRDRTGLDAPVAIALDSHGNIYVANDGRALDGIATLPNINIYSPNANGNTAPITSITGAATGLFDLGGIAVDSIGNLCAINRGNSVVVFPVPHRGIVNRAAAVTIAGYAARLDFPQALALAPSATRMPTCAAH